MKKILYIDMDNVLVDFKSGLDKIDPEIVKKHKGDEDDIPDIFSLMTPMEGAIEAFKELAAHFDVYILSTAPWDNPSAWHHKLLWVKEHLPKEAYKRLILTHNKQLNTGDYLIDDRTANGAGDFKGEHIHFGTDQFPDWDCVLKHLITVTH